MGTLTLEKISDFERSSKSEPPSPTFRPSQVAGRGKTLLQHLAPRFLHTNRSHTRNLHLHPTKYLDGVRGVAALFVVFHHIGANFTANEHHGYYSRDSSFFTLPGVRVFHAGRFMVQIFFVLSGYVLSIRGLQLGRQGNAEKLLDSLASSVFRRWFRLYIPVLVATFMGDFVLARLDWYRPDAMQKGWEHLPDGNSYIGFNPTYLLRPRGSFLHQLYAYFERQQRLANPFSWHLVNSKQATHVLWTIPFEWLGSMITFLIVLALSRTKPWVRISGILTLIYYANWNGYWEPITFLSGILLAELSLIRAENDYTKFLPRPRLSFLIWLSIFLLAIYIGSHPLEHAHVGLGYQSLLSWVPTQYYKRGEYSFYWPTWGAFLLILSCEHSPHLQRIFTTRFAQFLGDISYSMYLLHFQLLMTLCQFLVPRCMTITGGWANGEAGFAGGMAIALAIWLPVLFWVSDVFARLVDMKAVAFAKWLSQKAFADYGSSQLPVFVKTHRNSI